PPDGMGVTVVATSPTSAQLRLFGFRPGEKLVLVSFTEADGSSNIHELSGVGPVDETGRFEWTLDGLRQLPDTERNHWKIRVIHERGVACAEVTLLPSN
ncbi:MAG: hypothetical protein ACRDIB_17530, partial [Ardenticatenaceae bacterium]